MALTDRDALRIYRDPMIPPAEKRRLLAELEAGAPQMSDLRIAGPGVGEGGTTGADLSAPSGGTLGGPPAPQGDIPSHGASGVVPAGEPPPQAQPVAAVAPPPLPDEAEPVREGAPQGPPPDQYRSSLNRALLQLQGTGGAAPKPTETVSEQVQVQQGTLAPDKAADIAAAEAERDDAAMQRERAATSMAWAAEDSRIKAEEAALKERAELAEMQRRTQMEAQRLRERQNVISEEIASADVKQPGLWSRDNFGENLLTALSVALFAIGSRNGSGAEHVKALANREVDRQERWLKAQGQKRDALGTILERHYANFGDVEAAKKQAVVDILGKAELEVRRQALDAEKAGFGQALPRLQEQSAALKAARLEAEADRDKRLGNVIQTSAARSMVRERSAALQPLTVQQPGPQPQGAPRRPMTPEEQRTMGELNGLEKGAQAGLRGEKPPAGAAPVAPGRPPAAPPPKGDAVQKAYELHRSGKPDEAIMALPPQYRQALLKLYTARKADMGAGTTDADALDAAFRDLGMSGPETAQLVPQAARERMVTLGTGERLYAPTKEIAKDTQAKVAKLDGTVGGLSKMLALSRKYKSSGTIPPAVKSEIESLGQALMFDLSLAQEQGTVREAELPLYEKMVGSAIANYFKDPRYDLEAGLREIRRVFAGTRQRLIGNLSPSPTGEGAPQRAREIR